jgi:alanine-glyoxylate transaminase/serine-glyoxylate transaminase/serine-pyruvate transaminase
MNGSLDVVLTASQKSNWCTARIGTLMVSEKAMQVWENRKTPVPNYYADWSNWLPIMKAYERRLSYFGTPAVNLIVALETSLKNYM